VLLVFHLRFDVIYETERLVNGRQGAEAAPIVIKQRLNSDHCFCTVGRALLQVCLAARQIHADSRQTLGSQKVREFGMVFYVRHL